MKAVVELIAVTCLGKSESDVAYCEIPLVDSQIKESNKRRSAVKQVNTALQQKVKENLLCERGRIMEENPELTCLESVLCVPIPLLMTCAAMQHFIRLKVTLIYAPNIGRDYAPTTK